MEGRTGVELLSLFSLTLVLATSLCNSEGQQGAQSTGIVVKQYSTAQFVMNVIHVNPKNLCVKRVIRNNKCITVSRRNIVAAEYKLQHRYYRSPLFDTILVYFHPPSSFKTHIYRIPLNVILPYSYHSSKYPLSKRFSRQNFVCVCLNYSAPRCKDPKSSPYFILRSIYFPRVLINFINFR